MATPSLLPGAHPVLSCQQSRAWEAHLLAGDESREWAAMTRAGRAVASAVEHDALEAGGLPDSARVLVLCGKGHNGGDALIALRALLGQRLRATALIVLVPGFAALRPLVRRALEKLVRDFAARIEFLGLSGGADGRDLAMAKERIAGEAWDLCLDGLYGMQFRPPLRSPVGALIAAVSTHAAIRVRAAVDLPSGVGDASAEAPFRADFTYATGIAKLPLFASANRQAVGRVRYLDLGFFDSVDGAGVPRWSGLSLGRSERAGDSTLHPAATVAALDCEYDSPDLAPGVSAGGLPMELGTAILTDHVLDPLRQLRATDVDKRTFGHLFVVSGSRAMPGAVFMAVDAALLSGVGLVTAFVPESVAGAFAAQRPEAMWVPMPETPAGGLALEGRGLVVARAVRCTGLLIGPGLGREPETLALISEILAAVDVPVVLDADALQTEVLQKRVAGPNAPTAGLVLTPHAGEFDRIAGTDAADDAALRAAAGGLGATIVLKGAPTRISDGGTVHVSPFGGPVLARGGSGDVLAGLVAGQLAAGAAPMEAAARGVVWHGLAADRLAQAGGQASARVTQISGYLADVLGGDRDRG